MLKDVSILSYDEDILKWMDSHRNDIIALERKLIQTKSVNGNESQAAKLVAEECEKDGLKVELVEPAPERVSVVARYKGTAGKPKVIWYTHYDTLPAGEESNWKHPPFSATIDDDWIYGRGAHDNKTATCASIMAFRAVKNLGIKLKGDLVFTHVADEERGGKFGFKNLIDKGYGEGIDCLFYPHGGPPGQLTIAANGSRKFKITVKAPPVAEGPTPFAGPEARLFRFERSNAILEAVKIIPRLEKLADEVRTRKYRLPGTDSTMVSRFNINMCHAYLADNAPPKVCDLLIDRRWTPAETAEQTDQEVRQVIDDLKAEDPKFDAQLTVIPEMDLSVSAADSELVKVIQRSAKRLIGYEPKPAGGSHSSDHGFFNTKYRKPLASYGIGGENAHSPNERVKVEDVILTAKLHGLIMVGLLGC